MSEITVFERENITEQMNRLGEALSNLDTLTKGIDVARGEVQALWEAAKSLSAEAFRRDDLIQEYEQHINGLLAATNELERQRDMVLDEQSKLLNKLLDGDFFDINNPYALENRIYEAAVDQHMQGFWEALPYTLAEMMGGRWTQKEADFLYGILTDEAEEFADGVNLETEDVLAFREVLFDMVVKLMEKGE